MRLYNTRDGFLNWFPSKEFLFGNSMFGLQFKIFFIKFIDSVNHGLHQLNFGITQSVFVWNVVCHTWKLKRSFFEFKMPKKMSYFLSIHAIQCHQDIFFLCLQMQYFRVSLEFSDEDGNVSVQCSNFQWLSNVCYQS